MSVRSYRACFVAVIALASPVFLLGNSTIAEETSAWKKHIVHEGFHTNTAIAADFTGDGMTDVISSSGGKTRLFVGPKWREIVLDATPGRDCIHSEVMDVDGDRDLDWIGAQYEPGLVFWLECPDDPLKEKWQYHLISDKLIGIHGLMVGNVDGGRQKELLANSAQPKGDFPDSLAWLKVPADPRSAESWATHIFADKDAPGLSHYLGIGDVNGDGRPDAASAAKGGPTDTSGKGNWFAWWEAPKDPTQPWKKHMLSANEPGATNIHPADVNGDGKIDFVASRGHGRGVIWFEAPSWEIRTIHETLKEPHCLVVADIDQDGDQDVATCAYGDEETVWFENDGSGNFESHVLDKQQQAYDIRAVDMDVDNDLDLLVAGRASNNVVWYENPDLNQTPTSDPGPGKQVAQTLSADGQKIRYWLSLPKNYSNDEKLPVMLFLHGRGESYGTLDIVKKWGPPRLAERGEDLPYIIVSPQCPAITSWSSSSQQAGLMKLLDHVIQQYNVDEDRVYLTGLSMGGYGTWRLAAEHANRFAAVLPICGGGNPADAEKLKGLPIWVFHGDNDTAVPFQRSVEMVEAIRKAGGTDIRFTTLENVGHNSWSAAYATPEIYGWFNQHSRSSKQ